MPNNPQTTLSPFMERFLHGSDEKIHVEAQHRIPRPGYARAKHLETVLRAVIEAIDDHDYDGARIRCKEALK